MRDVTRRAVRTGAAGVALAAVAGCGRDDLARPVETPGAATWAAVALASTLVVLVGAATVTWPAWRSRVGSRLAVVVLGLQAATAWLVTAVAIGAAFRIEQLTELAETRPRQLPAESLIELGRVGDASLPRLLQLATLLLVGLPAVLLTIGARFAASDRVAERVAASVLLALQVGGWGVLLVRDLSTGEPGWTTWAAAVNLPLAAIALTSCWPSDAAWEAPA